LRKLVLASLCTLVAACSPEETQSSRFDRLLGQPLQVTEPAFSCKRAAGLDISAFTVWQLPPSVAEDFRSPEIGFWSLPKPGPYQEEYEVIPWRRLDSGSEHGTVLDTALRDLDYVTKGECRGRISADVARVTLAEALARPTTYLSYKIKRVSDVISVLDLAVLDPNSTYLYEIYIDF
jgi:hypothetical protein